MPGNNLQYVTINDFRPGIISSSRSSSLVGATLDMPPGTAAEGTQGCLANATGQLCPAPDAVLVGSFQPGNIATTGASAYVAATAGIATSGPISLSNGTIDDDIHIFTNLIIGTAPNYKDSFTWDVIKPGASQVTLATYSGLTANPPPLTTRGVTHCFTRARASSFLTPGFPVTAVEWTGVGSGLAGPWVDGSFMRYALYPNPASLTVDTPFLETGTVANGGTPPVLGGQILAHSGRIIRLCETSTSHGVNQKILSNEYIRFTDPPNSESLASGTNDSVFDPQNPGGYGSWGSLSFGELLLIKRQGGALLVEGDVYAPTITRLPGVASTGSLLNPASQCPAGLVYCVKDDGAYLWNGGSTSQKISKINDTFYQGVSVRSGTIPPAYGVQCGHAGWNQFVVFTNGWMYDSVNDSWWQLNNPFSVGTPQWFAPGFGKPSRLYTVAAGLNASNKIEVYYYDRTTRVNNYTWISQPIPVSMSNTIDIQEIDLSLSNVDSRTSIAVTMYGINGAVSPTETITINGSGNGPFRVRNPIGIRGNGIQIKLVVTAASFAPTINCIQVGYREAGPYGQS